MCVCKYTNTHAVSEKNNASKNPAPKNKYTYYTPTRACNFVKETLLLFYFRIFFVSIYQ